MKKIIILCIFLILGIPNVYAFTHVAVDCNRSAIQALIDVASPGDTIIVPAGNCTWENHSCSTNDCAALYITKSINIIGDGIDSTNIVDGTSTTFYNKLIYADLGDGEHVRISGFTFSDLGVQDSFGVIYIDGTANSTFRIDHNKFNELDTSPAIIKYAVGVIDNNEIIESDGLGSKISVEGNSSTGWSRTMPLGTSASVFIEDNIFSFSSMSDGVSDSRNGGSYVFRYNNVTNSIAGSHGYDTSERSVLLMEAYDNTFSKSISGTLAPGLIQYRGGSGIVFNNTVNADSTPYMRGIAMTNYRSCSSYSSAKGLCNGECTSPIADQNTSPTETYRGWPCVDQVGRGTDQGSYPIYIWGNTWGGTYTAGSVDVYDAASGTCYTDTHIQANRDYYNYNASFDGTNGVGSGLKAAMPAICTTGVAYWVTDEGEWNSENAGNDGRLYKCTSTDTWNLYYTPYTYPHPLRNEGKNISKPGTPLKLEVVQ